MRHLTTLMLICMTVFVAGAQEISPILKGRVFAPDGTPVRNQKAKLYLRLKTDETVMFPITVKIDGEGVLTCEQLENLDWREREMLKSLERQKGKRAIAWVYLFIPDVGAVMTRRFFWTIGEPLPDLHLKPLARLKVEFVCPVLKIPIKGDTTVRRVDDAEAAWDAEWVPAGEWLTVAGMSVKLQPGEEKRLVVPVMPSSNVPVYLKVQFPYIGRFEPRREVLPPLPAGKSMLKGYWGSWEGLAFVNREEPFNFVFVPPTHLLRIPVERVEMRPLLDTPPSPDYLPLSPTPITEVECEIAEGSEVEILGWNVYCLKPKVWEAWESVVRDFLWSPLLPKFLHENLLSLMPQSTREGLIGWLSKHRQTQYEGLGRGRSCKFWVTRWTPAVVKVTVKVAGEEYTVAFLVKGSEAAVRQHFKIELRPPKREPRKVAPLKKGRLEGIVQTLDGKPVADVTVVANFAESALVERLIEGEEFTYFLANTDEHGRFVFPNLPEGKYDLSLESFQWTGCAEAIVNANKTTKVKLVALKSQWPDKPSDAAPKRRFTVQFQFPDGTPVAGYEFDVSPSNQVSPSSGRTDEQGCVSFETELKWFYIHLRPLETLSLQVPPDQSKVVVTVPLRPLGMVEGKVSLPDGSTSDRIIVTVWKLRRSEWGEEYNRPSLVRSLRVLPDGRFFCSLPEGTYVFKAEQMWADYGRLDCAPSFSPPVNVKGGEVTKVEWQLKPVAKFSSFKFTIPKGFEFQPPTLATLRVRTEHYDGQIYESKHDLPISLLSPIILEPLAKLDEDERALWDEEIAPGIYRLTSWGWFGEEFNAVVRISQENDQIALTPPSAFPTLTVTGQILLPNNKPASNAIVALYDPQQKMKRWATVCDENGRFNLSVQLPSRGILERQHLDTLLPNSGDELWLIAWKVGYGHSLILRLPRPRYGQGVQTVDVGSLNLSRPERIEGQVLDEDGKPLPFVGVIMLPADEDLFTPKPDKETLMCELTAFEDFDVGSIPHAQADINGRFCVEGLRRGRYLLVAKAYFWEDGKLSEIMAYQFVNVPSDRVVVRLRRLNGVLTASPSNLTNALPFAEAQIWMPCWHQQLRADEFGQFKTDRIPNFGDAPMLVRIMHRDGMVVSFNPPKDWHYSVQLRP